MERELFDWKSWDSVDEGHYLFYGVTTKVDIVDITVGTCFKYAQVDYADGLLKLYNDNEEDMRTFKLLLNVGEEVNSGE